MGQGFGGQAGFIGDVEQAARFEQAGAVGLFGLVARREGNDDGAAAGLEDVHQGVVAGLTDRQGAAGQQFGEVGTRPFHDDAGGGGGAEGLELGFRNVRTGEQAPTGMGQRRQGAGFHRGAQQRQADGSAADRDDDFAVTVSVRGWGFAGRGDVAGVADQVADGIGWGEGRFERHQGRVAVDQHQIKVTAGDVGHFGFARRIVLGDKDVADRCGDKRAGQVVQQGEEFETELTAAEGVGFQQQDIGIDVVGERQEGGAAAFLPGVVQRAVAFGDQQLEAFVRRAGGG